MTQIDDTYRFLKNVMNSENISINHLNKKPIPIILLRIKLIRTIENRLKLIIFKNRQSFFLRYNK